MCFFACFLSLCIDSRSCYLSSLPPSFSLLLPSFHTLSISHEINQVLSISMRNSLKTFIWTYWQLKSPQQRTECRQDAISFTGTFTVPNNKSSISFAICCSHRTLANMMILTTLITLVPLSPYYTTYHSRPNDFTLTVAPSVPKLLN